MPPRVVIVGLHQPEYEILRKHHFGPIIHHEFLPKIAVKYGQLLIQRTSGSGMLPLVEGLSPGGDSPASSYQPRALEYPRRADCSSKTATAPAAAP